MVVHALSIGQRARCSLLFVSWAGGCRSFTVHESDRGCAFLSFVRVVFVCVLSWLCLFFTRARFAEQAGARQPSQGQTRRAGAHFVLA